MNIKRAHQDRLGTSTRGQGMVEFALVLPILVVLLVLAIDFGRVFFQWVGVSNASRIAANYAARNPDAWGTPGDAAERDEYARLVSRDLNPLNCTALDGSEVSPSDIPSPSFTGQNVGDQVTVTLQCRFAVLTPVASLIVGGNQFTVTADSVFTVNGGRIAGIPVGNVPPESGSTAPCSDSIVPQLVGKTVDTAQAVWVSRFTGLFTAPGGALPDEIVTGQTTSPPAAVGACVDATTSVTVTVAAATTCTGSEARVPSLVDLTVAAARLEWTDAGFTGSFLPSTGSDTETVTSQDVSSGDDVGECAPISALVTVGSEEPTEYCEARQLTGLSRTAANNQYDDAGFTGDFKSTGNPSGTVTGQKLTGGQDYPCSADEDVKLTK